MMDDNYTLIAKVSKSLKDEVRQVCEEEGMDQSSLIREAVMMRLKVRRDKSTCPRIPTRSTTCSS